MKKLPKGVMHTPRNIAIAETTSRLNHIQRQQAGVTTYEITPGDLQYPLLGELIARREANFTRAMTELSGAYSYIFNGLSYYCSQFPKNVDPINDKSHYYMVNIPYDIFLDITTGNRADQKDYLKNEIYHIMHKQQPKSIPWGDKGIYAQPFLISMQSKSLAELSQEEKKNLANIESDKIIGSVQIFFLKALFEDIVENKGKFINMPKNFFAMLVEASKRMVSDTNALIGLAKLGKDIRAGLLAENIVPAPIAISTILNSLNAEKYTKHPMVQALLKTKTDEEFSQILLEYQDVDILQDTVTSEHYVNAYAAMVLLKPS